MVARIEAGRYEPTLVEADTLELARVAAAALGEQAGAGGSGAGVRVHREPTERALVALGRCALRHGGLERVEIAAEGTVISIAPVTEAGPILLGEDLRDLGAAAARRLIEAFGGSLAVEDERLLVRLPAWA